MRIKTQEIFNKALERAFCRVLEPIIQQKAEAAFEKAFSNGSPFSQKLQQKIEESFERFFEKGIRWGKKQPGVKS